MSGQKNKREPEDRLEKFVLEHRNEFDTLESPRLSFSAKNTHTPTVSWIWKAAAVVFFLTSSLLLLDRFADEATDAREGEADSQLTEFMEATSYYNGLIQVKRSELDKAMDFDADLSRDFAMDLGELDSIYQGLQKELGKTYDEKIVDAILQNLTSRIEILDRQLQIAQDIKKLNKSSKDEEVSI